MKKLILIFSLIATMMLGQAVAFAADEAPPSLGGIDTPPSLGGTGTTDPDPADPVDPVDPADPTPDNKGEEIDTDSDVDTDTDSDTDVDPTPDPKPTPVDPIKKKYTPVPKDGGITKTGPELLYLLIPSLVGGYAMRKRK
ncbi:hypothetical protein M0P48_00850 [Candidatus Gracilibacteria bacterium]|nr:hypothetical protein [Candidatus Gracilibacteria bacterium]